MAIKKKQVVTAQVLGMFFLLSCPCFAVSLFVPGQYPTIQAAINDCNDGDTVIISTGTYAGTDNRNLDFGGRAITVRSLDPEDPGVVTATIIDCQSSGRGFYFHTAETESSVVSGLTIINGSATNGGGIYCIFSSPKITNCIFSGNRGDYGGGMYSYSSSPNLTGCEFSDNSATNDGGGIYQEYGNSTLKNCIFLRNVSDDTGGGICIKIGSMAVTNSTFAENSAIHGKAVSTLGYWYTDLADINMINSILCDGGNEIYAGFFGTAVVRYSNIQDGYSGTGNINADPCFVTGSQGDYYLSHIVAGQGSDSPCVNAGSDTAPNMGMDEFTTRTDYVRDNGIVDMGYHYPVIPDSPDIDRNLSVDLFDFSILANYWLLQGEPNDSNYRAGDITRDLNVDFKDISELADAWLNCLVKPASVPNPADGAMGTDANVVLSWSAGYGALEHDVYFGTDANTVGQANRLSEEFMDTVSEVNFALCLLDFGTPYFWRIDEVGPRCTTKGVTWRFATYPHPGKATDPVPAYGTIIINPEIVELRWGAGIFVTSHDVYIGTDFNNVNEANTLSPEFKGSQTSTSYEMTGFNVNTTYYWRIDGNNSYGTAKGDVWSFSILFDPNFVSWWKFDEGTGTTAYDSVGSNDGIVNKAEWIVGKVNGALNFDGYYDSVDVSIYHLWNKYIGNPVLPTPTNAFGSVWLDEGIYHFYYTNLLNVYHATSSDGLNWQTYPDPVLTGTTGQWDERIEVSMVFKDNDTWYMLYRGHNYIGLPYSHAIGLASSADGINWQKSEFNPVLTPTSGEWDGVYMDRGEPMNFDPWGIMKIGSTYHLWFNADNPSLSRATGLATSTDLVNWTKDANNPIFTHGRFCVFPFKYGDYYYMIVTSGGYQKYVTTFELYRDKNPTFYLKDREFVTHVLKCGPQRAFDEKYLDTPCAVTNDIYRDSFPSDTVKVYYTGEAPPIGVWRHGLATFNLSDLVNQPSNKLPYKTNNMTYAAWIKPDTLNSSFQIIINNGTIWTRSLFLYYSMLRGYVGYSTSGAWGISISGTIQQGIWQHVALVLKNNIIHLYVNGNEVIYSNRVAGVGPPIDYSGNNLTIGNDCIAPKPFNGSIDEVLVYDRALSAEEIRELANSE
ncbi:MAG: hypothetical protein PHY02_03995 [Phycisphaerae bacterium]|nr:hypothetical protein [Phycisphaerae bacterium]